MKGRRGASKDILQEPDALTYFRVSSRRRPSRARSSPAGVDLDRHVSPRLPSAVLARFPFPCCLLRSADADDAQASWRDGRAAGERRGGCKTVTEPTETAEIAALRVKANAGDADAQYNLGVCYNVGHGVPQDSVQGAAWIRKAAEQGLVGAQFNLGLMYAYGRGV